MEKQETLIRFCLYARKSSESDERQAISIESQVNEMLAIAKKDKLQIGDIYRESHSAKSCGQRKIFHRLLKEVHQGIYSGIITWSPDRLSRNAGDLGILVDLMDEGKLKKIVTFSQTFTNNPNEKFLLMILGSQAKLENDNRSINILRGIRNICQLGYYPGQVPLGYMSETIGGVRKTIIDPNRGEIILKIFQKVANGTPVDELLKWLRNETNLRSRSGNYMIRSVIYPLLRNPFYYGRFIIKDIEYQGNYEPLISKELFDQVQSKLRPFRNKYPIGDKYSLAKFLKCSICGSPVHRGSKYRKMRNGKANFHVYYRCSHENNKYCKADYVPEEDVFQNIAKFIEAIDISKIHFPDNIQDEITRFERMSWDIYRSMINSKVNLSIYPYKYEEIDEEIIHLYLRNMVLYSKPEKRFYILSLIFNSIGLNNKYLLISKEKFK